MKKLQLNHHYTPEPLKLINERLIQLLEKEELDDEALLEAINQRDTFIQTFLSEQDTQTKVDFAREEVKVNTTLTDVSSKLLSESLNQVSKLLRAQKAVKKYK